MSEDKSHVIELTDPQIEALLELVDRELQGAKLLVDLAAHLRSAKVSTPATSRPTGAVGEPPRDRRP